VPADDDPDGEGDGAIDPDAGAPALDGDALAGVVDLFGALTRAEVDRALAELAARRGEPADADVAGAIETYHLVSVDAGAVSGADGDADDGDGDGDATDPDADWLAVGPVAFPTLPPGAEDLPHVLDVERRTVDRAAVVDDVESRLRGDAARAVVADDVDRMYRLLDVTYDLETWATADVADVRARLDDALAGHADADADDASGSDADDADG
jgi:hypothetical protein